MQLKFISLAAIAAYTVSFSAWAQNDNGNVEPKNQPNDTELVFSNLELDQTNRGTVNINGYDRQENRSWYPTN